MSGSDDKNNCKSVSERLRFFPTQVLTADDLATEQEYVLERLRTRNRMTRGWGVVCGLSVDRAGSSAIRVGPGYALSALGDEVVLQRSATIDLTATLKALHVRLATVFVAVRYTECLAGPVPALVPNGDGDTDESQFSRVRSSHELSILDVFPQSHVDFAATQLAWQTTWIHWVAANALGSAKQQPLPVPPCPPCPTDSWVVLAAIRLVKSKKTARIEAIDFAPRRVLWPSWAIQSVTLSSHAHATVRQRQK